ncbi:MAG: ImmA/IrrE family metallo-endopeptidase [Ruminococcaceae bacterium]|nr:ImmA/IrrE family metallo-endopeptidase [Oscillospiraceae bacterium]
MAFRLSDSRCEEIKEVVTSLLEKLDISSIPIHGFEIASKLKIIVIPYSSFPKEKLPILLKESEDGFSVKYNNQWYIYYNNKKGYGRINNTITHECGHIVLDHTEESELAEAEAKFFAKYTLALPVLIHKIKYSEPSAIADRFDISYEAAGYALSYYRKWLRYGNANYTPYEERQLMLFKDVV